MRRALAIIMLWLGLAAARSPVELMPMSGRSQAFGHSATVLLTPAVEDGRQPLGRRPLLVSSGSFTWQLDWVGSAYAIRFEGPGTPPDGSLALHPIGGGGRLYAGQLVEAGAEAPRFDYFLLWRLSRREFVGYMRLGDTECDALSPAALAAAGIAPEDAADCVVRSWPQAKALLRAFAATNPAPLGTIRKPHHPRPPRADPPPVP
jgi:hypothetical protein